MDRRIKQMSYSSNLTLHECARKLQLYKLRASARTPESESSSITFSFGHIVGLGIQLVFEGKSEDEIIWQMFQMWKPDIHAENLKQGKSFWTGVLAIQKFIAMRAAGYMQDYELVWYEGKPAVELSFRILLPNGFKYRGHVDAVLRHRITGEVVVLEVKTSSGETINPATYKNSAQAIGYSVVLDVLFPALSAYEVYYLVYKTKSREYEPMKFSKSYLQRALWVQELLLDVETLMMYDNVGVYPMRGESCVGRYYSECEYLQVCTLSTERLASPEPTEEELEASEPLYQIELTVADLIQAQLDKEI